MKTTNGQLFVVATPIGNLADLASRAAETLRTSDVVCAEDTRVTAKLLASIDAHPKVMALHQHSGDAAIGRVLEFLAEGKSVSLVTDAGTPGISDPGGELVARAAEAGFTVTPIPGPSAVIAALSVCGFPADRFSFFAFPPHKKGRATFFREVAEREETVVLYESTHRIMKTLAELPQDRPMMVGRELTKLHETIYRGTAASIADAIAATSSKGEFVIVLAPKHWKV
ncbi:16S rRNA (cytidine(1402)-2'-O)-methyltransferase [Candidatus Uhrbacteria bacterium]|nr:16S rRNA (cytidine(1402)-2'-O)-methyltransferase [Candidatus Uhrbacteria bacterium]